MGKKLPTIKEGLQTTTKSAKHTLPQISPLKTIQQEKLTYYAYPS
jgi:hypothetical protein